MKPIIKMTAIGLFLMAPFLFSMDFEVSEGFAADASLEGAVGWSADGLAEITDETSASGGQSLKIAASEQPAEIRYYAQDLPQNGIRFIKFSMRPVARDAEAVALNVWGSEMAFVRAADGVLQIGIASGMIVETSVQSEADGRADRWLTLVIRQDFSTQTWDLAVDGKLAAVDLPWEASRDSLILLGSETAPVYLDDLSIGKANPLFADADGDFLPTPYEAAHRLNPYGNDRNGDFDLDGISNILEALAGTRPDFSGVSGNRFFYVNNLTGNDADSGHLSYSAGADGPKASLKAAMAAAQSGDVIVVMKGRGIYDEGSRSAAGKRLTIKPVEPLTIK